MKWTGISPIREHECLDQDKERKKRRMKTGGKNQLLQNDFERNGSYGENIYERIK